MKRKRKRGDRERERGLIESFRTAPKLAWLSCLMHYLADILANCSKTEAKCSRLIQDHCLMKFLIFFKQFSPTIQLFGAYWRSAPRLISKALTFMCGFNLFCPVYMYICCAYVSQHNRRCNIISHYIEFVLYSQFCNHMTKYTITHICNGN